MVRIFVDLVKFRYPGLLAYVLVYDIPWILGAAWRIVRGWLDNESVKRIVFVDKTGIHDYIDAKYRPVHMGGNVS
jgi:hypothetical protein